MPDLHVFPTSGIPRDVALQIRSYVRIQWPFLDDRAPRLPSAPPCASARTFVVLDGEVLVSHAAVTLRAIEHAGAAFTVGGVSAVFTYPAYRGGGFARAVVRAATEHLDQSDADVGMLFCGEPLRSFYASCGWEPIHAARVLHGDRAAPVLQGDDLVMMRFISGRGRAARCAFETGNVYVGERTW